MRRLPPGPKGHWLAGSLPRLRRDLLSFFQEVSREYGDVAGLRFGPRRAVLLTNPAHIEQVLVADNRKFVKHWAIGLLKPMLGEGLLTNEGESHLRQRRSIQGAFDRDHLDAYGRTMVDYTERMLDGWKDGQTKDIHHEMTRLTLEIVAKALLDIDVGDDFNTISRANEINLEEFNRRFHSLWPLPMWCPSPGNLRLKRAIRDIWGVVDRVIADRRRDDRDRGDLLSVLVRAKNDAGQPAMSPRLLRDEIVTMFLAGHETTANLLAWAWYLLGQNPRAAAQLEEELAEVLGGRSPTPADVPRLIFTNNVVLETMRLYPPAYAIGRRNIEPVTIGGYDIPAGTSCLMPQYVVHRDPRWYDEPDEFRPQRWANGRAKQIPKYAYFPFGGGPRVCIGNSFALLESTLIVATIANRFRLSLVNKEPIRPWPSVTLRPGREIMVECQRAPRMAAVAS